MNPDWKAFLLAQHSVLIDENGVNLPTTEEKYLCPLAHLGVITIAGKDAVSFLQGQITCNVHDITDNKSTLGAICNPKGRVITTFLLVKRDEGYLLVLPLVLLETLKKRLQMYVMRAAVTLSDSSDELCLVGYCQLDVKTSTNDQFGNTSRQQNRLTIDLSREVNRQLLITDAEDAQLFWLEQTSEHGYQSADSEVWRTLDIIDGIPCLTTETSEEYIPQMLNLDTLGGISFTKGCYTGQEIVARTHYLGKSKRQMFVAECDLTEPPAANTAIIDESTGESVPAGHVLQAQASQRGCNMLVVLSVSETGIYQLKIDGKDIRLL
ncbi:MAG: folate-binding protein [Methylococcaceae bacterium]|nr:folate-binding protein [Methylococcaceae bacterium]